MQGRGYREGSASVPWMVSRARAPGGSGWSGSARAPGMHRAVPRKVPRGFRKASGTVPQGCSARGSRVLQGFRIRVVLLGISPELILGSHLAVYFLFVCAWIKIHFLTTSPADDAVAAQYTLPELLACFFCAKRPRPVSPSTCKDCASTLASPLVVICLSQNQADDGVITNRDKYVSFRRTLRTSPRDTTVADDALKPDSTFLRTHSLTTHNLLTSLTTQCDDRFPDDTLPADDTLKPDNADDAVFEQHTLRFFSSQKKS